MAATPLTAVADDAPLAAAVPLQEEEEDDDGDVEEEAGGLGDGAASGSGLPVRRRFAGALGATLLDDRHAGHTQTAASLRARWRPPYDACPSLFFSSLSFSLHHDRPRRR